MSSNRHQACEARNYRNQEQSAHVIEAAIETSRKVDQRNQEEGKAGVGESSMSTSELAKEIDWTAG